MTRAEAIEAAAKMAVEDMKIYDSKITWHRCRRCQRRTDEQHTEDCCIGKLAAALALPADEANETDRYLAEAGIDMQPAFDRLHDMVGKAKQDREASELTELRAENERLRDWKAERDERLRKFDMIDKDGLLPCGHSVDNLARPFDPSSSRMFCEKCLSDRWNEATAFWAENERLKQRAEQAEALLRECGEAWWGDDCGALDTLDTKLPKPE